MITALIRSLMCDPKERLQKTSKKVKMVKKIDLNIFLYIYNNYKLENDFWMQNRRDN